MGRRFMMLQKKLQELESDVFRLPLDQTAAAELDERFRFLDKLRAAEADSDPDQLRDIDERIARLRAAFSDGDDAHSICSGCNLQRALLLEDFSGKMVSSEEEEKEAPAPEPEPRGIGKYCGAFGCGMIVGMLLGLFYHHYLIMDNEAFVIPPT